MQTQDLTREEREKRIEGILFQGLDLQSLDGELRGIIPVPNSMEYASPILLFASLLLHWLSFEKEEAEEDLLKLLALREGDRRYAAMAVLLLSTPEDLAEKVLQEDVKESVINGEAMPIRVTAGFPSVLNGFKDLSCYFQEPEEEELLRGILNFLYDERGEKIFSAAKAEDLYLRGKHEQAILLLEELIPNPEETELLFAAASTKASILRFEDAQYAEKIMADTLAEENDLYKNNLNTVLYRLGLPHEDFLPMNGEEAKFYHTERDLAVQKKLIEKEKYIIAMQNLYRIGRTADLYKRKIDACRAELLMCRIMHLAGETETACEMMNRVLKKAAPNHYVMLFAEEGETALEIIPISKVRLREEKDIAFAEEVLRFLSHLYPKKIRLTKREKRILRCLTDKLRNREIAEEMQITERTVKFHTGNLYRKLGVRSRKEAVELAKRKNLL